MTETNKIPHSSWAEVYDIAYQRTYGLIYETFTKNTVKVINQLLNKSSKILDFGAGTGRLSIPLANDGHQITAVEPCQEMIDQLKLKDFNNKVESVCKKMEDFETTIEYDAALCVFTVIIYLLDEDSFKKSMSAAYNALRQGGILLLDIPMESVFRSYERKDNEFYRSVDVIPIQSNNNLFIYKEILKLFKDNGYHRHFEDEFIIRFWPSQQVIDLLMGVGFVLSKNLSNQFSGTGSNYYAFQKL